MLRHPEPAYAPRRFGMMRVLRDGRSEPVQTDDNDELVTAERRGYALALAGAERQRLDGRDS